MLGLFSNALPNMSPRPILSAGTLLARCAAAGLVRLAHEAGAPPACDKARAAACGAKASAPDPPSSTAAAPAASIEDRTILLRLLPCLRTVKMLYKVSSGIVVPAIFCEHEQKYIPCLFLHTVYPG